MSFLDHRLSKETGLFCVVLSVLLGIFGGCGDKQPVSEDVSQPAIGQINENNPGDTIVASWSSGFVSYGQIRDSLGVGAIPWGQYLAKNPDKTPLIAEQMQSQLRQVVLNALMVEVSKEQGIETSEEDVEQALAQLKSSARNEEHFNNMVHGVTGSHLRMLISNQLTVQEITKQIQKEIWESITDEDKRAFYDANTKSLFTKPHYTEGRRFLIEARHEPPAGVVKNLVRLVVYTVKKIEGEKTPENAIEAAKNLQDGAFAFILAPAPKLWDNRIYDVLREGAVELAPLALDLNEEILEAGAEESLGDKIKTCFVGRSEEEAKKLAEEYREQAAGLISSGTDVKSKELLFQPMIAKYSEDELVTKNLGNVNIYNVHGTMSPEANFGAEFMEEIRHPQPGELSPVARTHTGYGFMFIRRQQPEFVIPFDDEAVQQQVPHLIQEERYTAWKQALLDKYDVMIREDLIVPLLELDIAQSAGEEPRDNS